MHRDLLSQLFSGSWLYGREEANGVGNTPQGFLMVYRCRPGLDLLPTPCPGRADQRCPAHLSSPGIPELHRCAGFEPCQLFLSSTNTLLAVSSDTRAGFAFAISLGLKLSFPYNHPQPGPRLMLLNQCLCSCTPSLRLAHRKKETLSLSLVSLALPPYLVNGGQGGVYCHVV